MQNIAPKMVILHGYAGNEDTHWQTWLHEECKKLGLTVFYPNLPDPLEPYLKTWLQTLKASLPSFDADTIVVCHSLGCAAALQLLKEPDVNAIGRLILVAPTNPGGLKQMHLHPLVHFYEDLKWDLIRKKAGSIEMYRSDNDPYVSETEAKLWEKELQCTVHLIPGAEHLNVKAGYTTFPQILESIQKRGPSHV